MSVARHTVYNLSGAILPLGISLLTVPLYLQIIGLERYGVLALAWLLAGYLNFFDFGIGRATARRMAILHDAGAEARNRLFWTSAAMTLGLAVIAGAVFLPIAQAFLARMVIPAPLRPELADALWLLVFAVPVGVAQSQLNGVMEGRRAFGALNMISVAGNLLTALLPLATAYAFGPRLPLLVAATLAARAAVLLAQLLTCARLVPLTAPAWERREEVRGLLAFGGWATITAIAGPLLVYFDRFAIGAWLGAAAVGFYVIGYNLVAQLQVLPASFTRAIFPRLAELAPDESLGRSADALRAMIAAVTPLTIIAVALAQPFLQLWLGREVARTSGPVTVILLTGFWINALAFVSFARLQAMGRPDQVAKIHLSELLPYAVLLYAGMALAGLKGVAVAWAARCAADFLLLTHLADLLKQTRRELLIGGLLVLGSAGAALAPVPPGLFWTLSAVLVLVAGGWSWKIFPAHLRSQLQAVARRPLSFVRAGM